MSRRTARPQRYRYHLDWSCGCTVDYTSGALLQRQEFIDRVMDGRSRGRCVFCDQDTHLTEVICSVLPVDEA